MAKALLIVNPSSGKEKGATYKEQTKEALVNRFGEVEVKETEGSGDATKFASWAAKNNFDAVVAMGGDGTLNETINGLANYEHPPAFGFVPLGTVNDLARSAGIPLKPEKAIESLSTAILQPMDIGKIDDTYFMNVLAVGMIATATDQVSVEQKTKFGSIAYFIEGLKAFNRNELLDFEITYDDGKWGGEAALVVAGLTNSVGGMETWAPEAKFDDGLLHVFVLTKLGLFNTVGMLPQLISGKLQNNSDVLYYQTKNLTINASGKEIAVNVDGDSGPTVPVTIEVLPSRLNLFVPKDTPKKGLLGKLF